MPVRIRNSFVIFTFLLISLFARSVDAKPLGMPDCSAMFTALSNLKTQTLSHLVSRVEARSKNLDKGETLALLKKKTPHGGEVHILVLGANSDENLGRHTRNIDMDGELSNIFLASNDRLIEAKNSRANIVDDESALGELIKFSLDSAIVGGLVGFSILPENPFFFGVTALLGLFGGFAVTLASHPLRGIADSEVDIVHPEKFKYELHEFESIVDNRAVKGETSQAFVVLQFINRHKVYKDSMSRKYISELLPNNGYTQVAGNLLR